MAELKPNSVVIPIALPIEVINTLNSYCDSTGCNLPELIQETISLIPVRERGVDSAIRALAKLIASEQIAKYREELNAVASELNAVWERDEIQRIAYD